MALTEAQQRHFQQICFSAYINMVQTRAMTPAEQADYMREVIAKHPYVFIVLPEPGREHLSIAHWVKGRNPRNPGYAPPMALTTAFYVLDDDDSNDFIVAYGDQPEAIVGRAEIADGLWDIDLAGLQERVTLAVLWAREKAKVEAGIPSPLDHFDLTID